MQIVNDTPYAAESMSFKTNGGQNLLVFIVKGTFSYDANGKVCLASEQMPIFYGDKFYNDLAPGSVQFESDTVPYKPRTDIVLVGKAHAPNGVPSHGFNVSLSVGEVTKKISVIGNRTWRFGGRFKPDVPTRPEPFTTMDIMYENAFGGMDLQGGGYCEQNFIGKGYTAKRKKECLDGRPLPNLEDPEQLITTWNQRPDPVGFGFYGKGWQPRVGYLGTYDDKWRLERSPDLPEDFDPLFYNGAHPDLQISGYMKGGEPVELINLSPEGRVAFSLPGDTPVCRVKTYADTAFDPENCTTTDMPMQCDTVCIISEKKQFYQVWRGRYCLDERDVLGVNAIILNIEKKA